MNANAFDKLKRLAGNCSRDIKDKRIKLMVISRGEMWAIIGACHDIEKARAKKKSEVAK